VATLVLDESSLLLAFPEDPPDNLSLLAAELTDLFAVLYVDLLTVLEFLSSSASVLEDTASDYF